MIQHDVPHNMLPEGLDFHVILLAEDWNEPDRYQVGNSSISIGEKENRAFVSTFIRMEWEGSAGPPVDSYMIASYRIDGINEAGGPIGAELISTATFDVRTGELAYVTGYPPDHKGGTNA